MLRWFESQPAGAWRAVVDTVPDHCLGLAATLARDSAETWSELADRLEQRSRQGDPGQ